MSQSSSNNLPKIITSSFVVNSGHLNARDVLSLCKILETITSLKDEAIVQILGSLDFSKVLLEHFYLDFIEQANLHDVVTFQSYVSMTAEDLVEISITVNKKKGKWNVPIVNGSFVFTMKAGIEVNYSLS